MASQLIAHVAAWYIPTGQPLVNDMDGLSHHPHLRRITVDTPNGPVSYPAPAPVFLGEDRDYGAVPAQAEASQPKQG